MSADVQTGPPRSLTDRQSECLTFIESYIAKRERAPTIREIGQAMGIRSTNGVNDHLKRLAAKGLIAMDPLLSRSIRVIKSDLASTPTETRDPADDAAWPLPEGWSWAPMLAEDDRPLAWRVADQAPVWVDAEGLRSPRAAVPPSVARTLLARWEAGQA